MSTACSPDAPARAGCLGMALWRAANNDDTAEVRRLLVESGADVNGAGPRTAHVRAPLYLAADHGDVETAKVLLEAGADVNGKQPPETPLHTAARRNQADVAKILLESGANMEAADGHNKTPLQLAIEQRHDAVAKILVEAGATVPHELEPTPLQVAIGFGNMAVTRVLRPFEQLRSTSQTSLVALDA
jgi:ankyrin repeat protein